MQSTLLLKKQVEVEKVQEDLDIKRRQFAERMAACKAKEEELKKKQTQVNMPCLDLLSTAVVKEVYKVVRINYFHFRAI